MAPLDVLRRADGHDVVLPAVCDRLDRLLARRRAAGAVVADGEAVTIAVSILRGLVAVQSEDVASDTASWWVTSEGKPVLACGAGEESPARASSQILSALCDDAVDPGLRDVLTRMRDELGTIRTLVRDADTWEDALFRAADPEPLLIEVLGPASRRVADRSDGDAGMPDAPGPRRAWWSLLATAMDSGWAGVASDLAHRARRAAKKPSGNRIRPVLWAVAAAATVLVIGLSWPDSTEHPAAAEVPTVAPSTAPAPETAPPAATSAPDVAGPDDPAEALTALLAARDACTDVACRAALNEDAAEHVPGGAIDDTARSIRLLDDFGGLAVFRIEASGHPSQLVTIVTTPDGWRVRDVFDAADPPT
jgi:hypothetical protein